LANIIDPHEGGAPRYKSCKWKAAFDATTLFAKLQRAEYRYTHIGTPDTVVDRVASISFVADLRDEDKRSVLEQVRSLLATDPETSGKTLIEFPGIDLDSV
jgi:hypothetical protein